MCNLYNLNVTRAELVAYFEDFDRWLHAPVEDALRLACAFMVSR